MLDQRVFNTDGLPDSLFSKFSTALLHGPASFPTQFLRDLARAAGWTNGYAHMGLNSLAPNEQGEVQLGYGVFKYIYRNPVGAQLKPPEDEIVTGTGQEKNKVDKFHAKLEGTIRHYPVPLTLAGPRFGIVTTQYKKISDK